jgi:hypothetical protein
MPEPVLIAEIMREYAEKAVAHSQRFGVNLDYSEQSLLDVDAILAGMTEQGLIQPASLSAEESENLWIFCKAYGGYVGAVIIGHIGAAWHSKDAADGSLTVQLTIRERLTGSPPERVWKRLTKSEFDTIIGYYRGVQHVLGLALFVPAQSRQP